MTRLNVAPVTVETFDGRPDVGGGQTHGRPSQQLSHALASADAVVSQNQRTPGPRLGGPHCHASREPFQAAFESFPAPQSRAPVGVVGVIRRDRARPYP